MNGVTRPLILCAALALAVAFGACAEPQPANQDSPATSSQPTTAKEEAPVAATSPDASAQPAPTEAAPPQPAEVRAALRRIYKDAVAFDERAPRFVVGDFNGDGAQDIAVAVRPAAGKLSELNDELSNWIIADPRLVKPPDPRDFDPHQGVQKLPPPAERARVEPGDALLVVIHGFKDAGWRNPEAMQTYLLKNAVGNDMSTQARAEAQAGLQKKTLRLFGDVINERLNGESGFLYWTGASYGWQH